MTMSFLPKDYKEPEVSNYMKLGQGDNTFRVLSSAIVGWEYWVEEDGKRKPIRKRLGETIPVGDLMPGEKPRLFWAFIVWNRSAEKVQILEITQATIRSGIQGLVNSDSWGDPKGYDITIVRTGEGMETEYQVRPEPKKALDKGTIQLAKDMDINLEALYDSEDPFASDEAGPIAKEVDKVLG